MIAELNKKANMRKLSKEAYYKSNIVSYPHSSMWGVELARDLEMDRLREQAPHEMVPPITDLTPDMLEIGCCCSTLRHPPCTFCETMSEDEANAFCNGGLDQLRRFILWRVERHDYLRSVAETVLGGPMTDAVFSRKAPPAFASPADEVLPFEEV